MKRPDTARWEALGTSVVLRLTDPTALELARASVEHELNAIDRACSRFRADSELSRVNGAGGRPTHVSPLLMEALTVALRGAELTDGDADPTLGRALELAGYDRDLLLLTPPHGEPPLYGMQKGHAGLESRGEPDRHSEPEWDGAIAARVIAGWRSVTLDHARSTVRVPSPIRLDLGASAKAWAADRAAERAAQASGCGALVSIGGDIATCGEAPAEGWRIRVTDDCRSDPSASGQTVSILSGGLATSSTAVRRWSHDGHTMHHIIDPATQAPAETIWRTVSVAAACCADANIATTAALVRSGAAPAWLEQLGLPARLLDRSGNVTTAGSWPTG
ncbi:MAG TPA: FAD:protein FMN transferase [Solirubrobacteraceae bacterium]